MIWDNKRILFLSPHHDDMVYSSAITIRQLINRNCRITNLNLFTVSGWQTTNKARSIAEVSAMRLEEERQMSAIMGYETLSAGWQDSFARGLDAYQETTQCCDAGQVERLSAMFCRYLKCVPHDLVFVPLSAGNHIDHRYTRYLAERNCGASSTLVYYEDMPYIKVGTDIAHFIPDNSVPICFFGNFEAKRDDICVYSSQMEEKNIENIRQYGASLIKGRYSERIWVVNESDAKISY